MTIAFSIFLALQISAVLETFCAPGLLTGVRMLLAGTGLALVLNVLQPRESGHFLRLFRWVFLAALLALAWLIVQMLPNPFFAHSIWESAADALGQNLFGHITIDIGSTLLSFEHLLLLISNLGLALAVTIDRERAELGLLTLTISMFFFATLGYLRDAGTAGGEWDAAAFAPLLLCASAYLACERFEAAPSGLGNPMIQLAIALILAFLSCLLCIIVMFASTRTLLFISFFMIAFFTAIIFMKRYGISLWSRIALTAIVVIGIVIIAAFSPAAHGGIFAYSMAPAAVQDLTRRMMEGAPWVGTGGGTTGFFSGIFRVYSDRPLMDAPIASASWTIELGLPATLLLFLGVIVLTVYLVRGAMRRGRDSLYPAAGAAGCLGLIMLAFVDSGLRSDGLSLLLAGLFGLALAQSQGRRAQMG